MQGMDEWLLGAGERGGKEGNGEWLLLEIFFFFKVMKIFWT